MDDEIRIVIVGDNPLARAGLAAMLDNSDTCQLLGQVSADDNMLSQLDVLEPDVLVWDVSWETDLQWLRAANAGEFLILAMVAEAGQILPLWTLGVQGILGRAASAEKMLQAIQSLYLGLVVIQDAFVETLNIRLSVESTLEEALTSREMEVLQLLAEGLSNKGIAYQLGISDHTVKFHVNSIMTKLKAQSRTEAAVRATKLGLIRI